MSAKRNNNNFEKLLFRYYAKKFPNDPHDVVKELMEIDIKELMERGESREEAILEILEQSASIEQRIQNYEKGIDRLTKLFAESEISEASYKRAIKALEKKLDELKEGQKEKVPVIKEKSYAEIKLTTSRIIALVIIAFLVIGVIIGGIWWYSLPKTSTFTIQVKSNTDWAGSIGADGSSRTIEGYGSETREVTGTIAVAVIQKQTDYGYLTVTILQNGKVLDSQTTTAAYGVVNVSASG